MTKGSGDKFVNLVTALPSITKKAELKNREDFN